jgi:hypothetical protein
MPKKLSLYKSVKTECGWRYCKAAFHSNAKVKPNIVLVNGVEEKHAEGSYFTLSDNQWVALGDGLLPLLVQGFRMHILHQAVIVSIVDRHADNHWTFHREGLLQGRGDLLGMFNL